MSIFSEKLNDLMQEKNIKQKQLASELNITQQSISRYVNSEREPDYETLVKIAKYFDVSTDYLLGLIE